MRVRTTGGRLTGLLLLTVLSVGCAKEGRETAGQSTTRAEQSASRAEDAARRAEAAAGRVESAARRAEAAAAQEQRVRKPVHKKHGVKEHVKR